MALRMRIHRQVLVDRRADMDRRISVGMEDGVREAIQEYLEILEERVISQNIPGPPLAEQTIRIKERRGAILPSYKWLFEDVAIAETRIVTEGSPTRARGDLVAPPERPFHIYRLLEHGGVNETGNVVPARPLFTTAAEVDEGRVREAFKRGFYRGSGETP